MLESVKRADRDAQLRLVGELANRYRGALIEPTDSSRQKPT